MDIKGIASFILITFGLTWVGEGLLIWGNLIVFQDPSMLHNIMFLLVLWIPALGALLSNKISPTAEENASRIWPLPVTRAVLLSLGVLAAFLVFNLLATLGGWTEAQWGMGTLVNQIDQMMRQPLPAEVRPAMPLIMLIGGILITLLLGATTHAAALLGGEFGWRGYLLPRLLPLGRIPAYLIGGALWGLWFLPLIIGACLDLNEANEILPMTLCFMGVGVTFGAVLGECWRTTRNLGLTALGVGAFAANVQGIWGYLFPIQKAPFTGPFGILSVITFLGLFLLIALIGRKEKVAAADAA